MKVLLIRPHAPNKLNFTKILDNEPLELEYLHTALKAKGIEDYIYDGLIEETTVKDTIIREKPDVVAITGYITQQNLMIKFCSISKEINPSIKTIVGGVHAQRNFEVFFNDSIDYVYRSESVDDFAKLILIIKEGNEKVEKLKIINGLCFKEQGKYIKNQLTPIDINELPIPDREHFYKNKSKFRYLDLTEVATIKTAFSCPYSCNFCYCTLLNGGKYQARDLNLVMEELKNLDCQNVQIADDDFLIDKDRLWEFIRLIKENNIQKTFICYSRADFVCENEDIIKALADIGFKYFLVGLEAVDDSELKGFNKQTSVDMNERCVKIINSTSSKCIALMIVPIDADKKYFDNLYRWVKKVNVKYVTVSIFTPIPGTPLFDQYKDKITSEDPEDWDFLHLVLEPTKLSRQSFYREYNKLFMRLYKIAKKTGIYDFMDLKYYKNMLTDYLKRRMRGD
ncbi:UNVERIFIED_CONTAM: radical SAM superfamily enzyme YgiQ (UPF0313 family) [Acetivibrio alkalicellulosi]